MLGLKKYCLHVVLSLSRDVLYWSAWIAIGLLVFGGAMHICVSIIEHKAAEACAS